MFTTLKRDQWFRGAPQFREIMSWPCWDSVDAGGLLSALLKTPKGIVKSSKSGPRMVASSRARTNEPVPQPVVATAGAPPNAERHLSHISLWKPTRTTQWRTPRFEPGGRPIWLRAFNHESWCSDTLSLLYDRGASYRAALANTTPPLRSNLPDPPPFQTTRSRSRPGDRI